MRVWIPVPKSNEKALRCGHADIFVQGLTEGPQYCLVPLPTPVIIDCDLDPMWHFNSFLNVTQQ